MVQRLRITNKETAEETIVVRDNATHQLLRHESAVERGDDCKQEGEEVMEGCIRSDTSALLKNVGR